MFVVTDVVMDSVAVTAASWTRRVFVDLQSTAVVCVLLLSVVFVLS